MKKLLSLPHHLSQLLTQTPNVQYLKQGKRNPNWNFRWTSWVGIGPPMPCRSYCFLIPQWWWFKSEYNGIAIRVQNSGRLCVSSSYFSLCLAVSFPESFFRIRGKKTRHGIVWVMNLDFSRNHISLQLLPPPLCTISSKSRKVVHAIMA